MALWTMAENGWAKVPMHGTMKGGKCVICGCGPSLATTAIPEDRYKIVLNDAYKTVEPDMWVALDEPSIFGPEIIKTSCVKVLRGGHQAELVDEREAASFPGTFFADLKDLPRECVFDHPHLDYLFVWKKQTMIFATQLAWYLGFSDVAFAGVDLRDGRHVPKEFTEDQLKKDRMVWAQQAEYFNWWVPEAMKRGITVSSLSGGLVGELARA